MKHVTVLLREAVESLAITPSSTVVDATYGAGGHSTAIAQRLGKQGTLIALDADQTAFAAGVPKSLATIHLVHRNFRELPLVLESLSLPSVDAILADLGWRLEQFTEGGKGFSFNAHEPLTMTFGDPSGYPFTAYDIVNDWAEESIADVIYGYGEDRYARRIARAIVQARAVEPITTAAALADVVASAVPKRGQKRTHPATLTFQALRITVNDELAALETFMQSSLAALTSGGRLSIITFHSLEDRIVKQAFRTWEQQGVATRLTKKPVVPTDEEIQSNPRSRSAKLRTIIKE